LVIGEYGRAVGSYRRARRLWEKNPIVAGETGLDREKLLFGEGRALLAAGWRKEAARVFSIYLADFPDGRFYKEVQAATRQYSLPRTHRRE
jgi:hypothetical protein